jgi:hypothetical protein
MTTDALLDELIRATQQQTDVLRQIASGNSSGGGGSGPDKDGIFKRGLVALGGASVDTAKSVGTLGKAAFDSVLSLANKCVLVSVSSAY